AECAANPIFWAVLGMLQEFRFERQQLFAYVLHQSVSGFKLIARLLQECGLVILWPPPQKIIRQLPNGNGGLGLQSHGTSNTCKTPAARSAAFGAVSTSS